MTLVITGEGGGVVRLPLKPDDAWRESLDVADGICVSEDARYTFAVEVTNVDTPLQAILSINGEAVASGSSAGRSGRIELDQIDVSNPFHLIFGFARTEVRLVFESGDRTFFSQDIPVLVRGSREVEERRVSLMYEELFGGSGDPALEMMLTGTPSDGRRFSIVEGSAIASAPRGLSTFVQMAERVLSGFEACLPAFRLHAASKISRTVQRVPRDKVSQLGTPEVLWIARHPDALERVSWRSPIADGGRFFLPRYVETERRARTFDIPENRAVVAFLDQASRKLRALSQMLMGSSGENERLRRALSSYAAEGYVLSSLIVADVSIRMRQRVSRELERLAEWAGLLRGSYLRAIPGVPVSAFKLPRRSKIFQEIDPYGKLYQLMLMWCSFGDVDVSGINLALRTERMDTFFEYYALHALLRALYDVGYVPDTSVSEPISTVRYSNSGQYAADTCQVANRYYLSRSDTRAILFYQPVFTASELEENGVTVHRLTSSGSEAPYTPDFLLRISSGGEPWRDVVFDAKYMSASGAAAKLRDWKSSGARATVLGECLRKYKLECLASDTGRSPAAVWLLCGRDHVTREFDYERSQWATSNRGMVSPSGAVSLSPLANGLSNVLAALGIVDSQIANLDAEREEASVLTRDEGLQGKQSEDNRPQGTRNLGNVGELDTPEVPETKSSASPTARPKPPEKGGDNLERDVEKLMALMPKEGADLYKARWAQTVLGMSEPLLRKTVSGKREAKRYRRITVRGKEVYLCKMMLLQHLSALQRYTSSLEKKAAGGEARDDG